jgi:hypothetical protein
MASTGTLAFCCGGLNPKSETRLGRSVLFRWLVRHLEWFAHQGVNSDLT